MTEGSYKYDLGSLFLKKKDRWLVFNGYRFYQGGRYFSTGHFSIENGSFY